jgi:hypothetical protein
MWARAGGTGYFLVSAQQLKFLVTDTSKMWPIFEGMSWGKLSIIPKSS